VGFKNPPAQIYYRPGLWSLAEKWPALRNSLIGKFGAYACLQEQMLHKHQFRVLEDFLEMHKEYPYHAHVHLTEYIHNDLNMAKHYDKDLSLMLSRLLRSGALSNTFFFLLGDHGYQRAEGQFVLTEQGEIENNMPAFVLLSPSSFANSDSNNNNNNSNMININNIINNINNKNAQDNIIKNVDKLTSHFDINQTLRDILLMSNASAEVDLRGLEGHGTSLFGELNANRTCQQADIPLGYCSCVDGVKKIDVSQKRIIQLAEEVLNDRFEGLQALGLGVCKPLILANIKDGWVKEDGDDYILKLQIQVEAKDAQFEIVVREAKGDISVGLTRQDWYSETGRCLDKEYLKPFCICS